MKSFALKKTGKVYTPKLYPLQNKSLCVWSGFTHLFTLYTSKFFLLFFFHGQKLEIEALNN